MLIYRIACVNNPGIGVFCVGGARAAEEQAEREGVFNPYEHPTSCNDVKTTKTLGYRRCGFQSLELYRIWFVTPGVRAALYASGKYKMRVYEVPDQLVDIGMVQCLFRLDDAISVRDATPEEYL